MSFGKMKDFIEIIQVENIKDKDGFKESQETIMARTRAYKEVKHGNEKWANLSVFSTATVIFMFRKIPNLDVTSKMMICDGQSKYQILSVEDVRGKGMYLEVLAEKVEASQNG